MEDKFTQKVSKFNKAYKLIDEGLSIIKNEFRAKPFKAEWATIVLAEKRIADMYRYILKCLESEATNDEFKKIISKLEGKL